MAHTPFPLHALGAGEAPDAMLRLNNANTPALTPLTPEALQSLVDQAFVVLTAGDTEAALIAFDERAAYASPNFLWFRARYTRFVYVDRVAVAPHARGRGLGRALYDALAARALSASRPLIVCEVNAEPPNPASDAFHRALGFAVVGGARLAGAKRVTYYARALDAAD